ncbi:MAG: hypothetical protein ACPGVD_05275, partial [Flavobacteriales bacterium]
MIKLKISHVLVVLLVCLSTLSSSQQFLDIAHPGRTTPLPAIPEITLYACESSPTNYSTTIDNFSPFVLTNISFTYKLPAGIIYAGNFSGGTISTATSPNESTVIVTIDSLVSNQVVTISFDIRAGCGVYQFGSTGGSFNINMDGVFTQKSNGVVYTRNYTFAPLVVNYPELQMSNWSYQHNSNLNYDRFNPRINDTVDRKITIVNGGTSRLDSVFFNSTHTSSLNLESYRIKSSGISILTSSTSSKNSHDIVLSGAHFLSVGNGDNYLDPGERFEMYEAVTISSCNSPNTNYTVSWGCGTSKCQTENDETRLVFPASSPRLNVTAVVDTALCKSFGAGASMGLRINNYATNAVDSAKDIEVDVYQGWNGFNNNMLSVIDISTIRVVEVGTGNPIPYSIVRSSLNNTSVCNAKGGNSIGRFKLNISKVYSGQQIFVGWKVFSCNNSSCYDNYRTELNWGYNLTYKNRCDVTYTEHLNKNALTHFDIVHNISAGSSPIFTPANTKPIPVEFAINNSSFDFLKDVSTDYLKYKVTLPPCLSFDMLSANAQIFIEKFDGTKVYAGLSNITYSGNVVTVKFNNNIDDLSQGKFIIYLKQNCATCTPAPTDKVVVESFYSVGSCSPGEHQLGCAEMPVTVLCNTTCPEFDVDFERSTLVRRYNFDLPDLNDDGLPDASAPMFRRDSVRTDRATYGDVIEQALYVVPDNQELKGQNYLYYYSKIKFGDVLTLDSVTLSYDGFAFLSVPPFFANYRVRDTNVPYTLTKNLVTGTDSVEYLIQLDISALRTAGYLLPSGAAYSHFELKAFYHVNKNLGLNITPVGFDMCAFPDTNLFTLSSNIDSKKGKWCYFTESKIDLIGFSYTSHDNNYHVFSSCDSIQVSETFRFNTGTYVLGNTATNYFPNEYRNFSNPDSLNINLSGSFNIKSAKLRFSRTAGTFSNNVSNYVDIMPYISGGGTSYSFVLNQLFKDPSKGPSTKPFYFSDEGYTCNVILTFEPNCNNTGGEETIQYEWKLNTDSLSPNLDTCNTPPVAIGTDRLEYVAPTPSLLPSIQYVRVQGRTVSWDVLVKNPNNSEASNLWFGFDNLTTLNVTNVSRIASGSSNEMLPISSSVSFGTINQSAGIYRLKKLTGGKDIMFRITAQIDSNNCDLDSLNFVMSYDCSGYPSSISTVSCATTTLPLYAQPMLPNLYNEVSTVSDTVGLCDTIEYTFKIQNTDIGRAYDVIGNVFLQQYLNYIPGSSEIFNTNTGTWSSITPSAGSFGQLVYNANILPNLSNGLIGFVDTANNYVLIKFKVTAECNYTSGSKIEVYSSAQAACGYQYKSGSRFSNQLHITGATPDHRNDVTITSGYLSPCFDSTEIRLDIVNLGPINTWVGDSVTIQLPRGIHYATGSYTPISNAVANPPSIVTFGGKEYLTWKLNNLVANVDSASFTIEVYSEFDSIKDCDANYVYAYTTTQDNVMCSSTGTICPVKIISGDETEPIFTYKATTSLLNPTAYSVPNPPSGETVYVSFDINNQGQTINRNVNGKNTKTVISYYRDVDGSGTFSPLDVLIFNTTHNIIVPQGISTFFDTVNLPSGDACRFIAVIDFDENSCVCNTSEILIINDSLVYDEPNDTICANSSQIIGYNNPITGYTYNWSAGPNASLSYLSASNVPSPAITASVPASGIDSMVYFIEIDRNGCTSKDTLAIYVIDNPASDAGNDTAICYDSVRLSGNTVVSPNPSFFTINSYWVIDSTYGNGFTGVSIQNPNSPNTLVTGLYSGSYKFIWVIDNGQCDPSTDTVEVEVVNPIFTAGNDSVLCSAADINLFGSITSSTKGFTSNWSFVNSPRFGASIQTPSQLNSLIQGLQHGVYDLELALTNSGCVFRDTVSITVNALPTVNAGNDSSFCGNTNFNLWADTINFGRTGVWTVDSTMGNHSNISISNLNSPKSIVNFSAFGNYTLIWNAIHNFCDTVSDTVNIFIADTISISAGKDSILCDTSTVVLYATSLKRAESGKWSQFSGANTVIFSDSSKPNSIVSGLNDGVYELIWTVSNGVCDSVTDTVSITVYPLPVAAAGADTGLCSVTSYTLQGNTLKSFETGEWIKLSGGSLTFANSNSPTTTITGLAHGTYSLAWTVWNSRCDSVTDTVNIVIDTLPIANAGMDIISCTPSTFTLSSISVSSSDTGRWSNASGNPAVGVFSDSSSTNSTVSVTAYGTYTFIWTVTSEICVSSSDSMTITIDSISPAYAGLDDTTCIDTIYYLNADTLLNNRDIGTWTQIDLNPAVTFTNVNDPKTSIKNFTPNTYAFLNNNRNGICDSVTDTVSITIDSIPVADAGSNDTICISDTMILNATAVFGKEIGTWTQLSGPSVTIADSSIANTGITGFTDTTYEFIWTVSNGVCDSVTDTVSITVYPLPVAAAGADTGLCSVTSYTLQGNTLKSFETGEWIKLSGGSLTFANSNSPTTTITGLAHGTYSLAWTVWNSRCDSVTDTVNIVIDTLPMANAGMDIISCDTGTFTLSSTAVSSSDTGRWTNASGNPAVGVFSDSSSTNSTVSVTAYGTYTFIWTVTSEICVSSSDSMTITIDSISPAYAGLDDTTCIDTIYYLNADTLLNNRDIGTWTQIDLNPAVTFTNVNDPKTSIKNFTPNTYAFLWTVRNGICDSVTDTVSITIDSIPVADAGSNDTICISDTMILNATAVFGKEIGTWTQLSGPSVTLADSSIANTGITGFTDTTYEFIWTVSNGVCDSVTDTVSIT